MTIMNGTENLVNLTEAARMLGLSRPTVYVLIAQGELHPVRLMGLPYVDKGDVRELKRRRAMRAGKCGRRENGCNLHPDCYTCPFDDCKA